MRIPFAKRGDRHETLVVPKARISQHPSIFKGLDTELDIGMRFNRELATLAARPRSGEESKVGTTCHIPWLKVSTEIWP